MVADDSAPAEAAQAIFCLLDAMARLSSETNTATDSSGRYVRREGANKVCFYRILLLWIAYLNLSAQSLLPLKSPPRFFVQSIAM